MRAGSPRSDVTGIDATAWDFHAARDGSEAEMANKKRQRLPLLYMIFGMLAFVVALDFIMGSPIRRGIEQGIGYDNPLVWAVLLMLVVAIAPFVILVNLGEDGEEK
jgi:hypothetical protein